MKIVRSPLRVTIGGGGTDLESYANKYGSYVISAAINKFVYVAVSDRFNNGLKLMYSKTEEVFGLEQIQHPIFRVCLEKYRVFGGKDFAVFSDVPGNTGLGSSSSFTCALLGTLRAMNGNYWLPKEIAEEAYDIEHNVLGGNCGRQDQYVAAHGGLKEYYFNQDGSVEVEILPVANEVIQKLNDRLVMFYTGQTRKAEDVLKDQNATIAENKDDAVSHMHFIKDLAKSTRLALVNDDLDSYGELLNEHWQHKRRLAKNMTNPVIDDHYEAGIWAGALGGKLIGAGSGGFMLYYVRPENKIKLISKMHDRGLRQMTFKFEPSGCCPIVRN